MERLGADLCLMVNEAATMNSDVKELNKLLCRNCNETDYRKCQTCKVYQLVNSIAF